MSVITQDNHGSAHVESVLPMFEADQVVRRKHMLRNRLSPGEDFVRPIEVADVLTDEIARDDLGSVLDKVEYEFSELARLCGGKVLEHEWGLVRREDIDDPFDYGFGRRPLPGHYLAARVPHVQGTSIRLPHEHFDIVFQGLTDYANAGRRYHYYDLKTIQFMHGTVHGSGEPGIWFTDLDLLFSVKRPVNSEC